MIKDRNGNTITIGDKFKYQVGTPYQIEGRLKRVGRGVFVYWSDGTRIRLEDFWYPTTDEGLTEIVWKRRKK